MRVQSGTHGHSLAVLQPYHASFCEILFDRQRAAAARAAIERAERLIHEATLCPLEARPADLVAGRVLVRLCLFSILSCYLSLLFFSSLFFLFVHLSIFLSSLLLFFFVVLVLFVLHSQTCSVSMYFCFKSLQAREMAADAETQSGETPRGGAVGSSAAQGEPELLVSRGGAWFSDLRRCLGVSHSKVQSIPSYEDRTHLRETVLRDQRVLDVIETMSAGDSTLVAKHCKQAARMYDDMAAKPSLTLVRFISWFIAKVFALFYPFGVEVDLAQVRAVQAVARQRGVPLVLLPTHKSHMDYLLVTYMCFMFNLPIPHVVAGDNLNIPIVGPLLRRGGAFFIRRSFGGDKLYAAVFDAYVSTLLKHGLCVECKCF